MRISLITLACSVFLACNPAPEGNDAAEPASAEPPAPSAAEIQDRAWYFVEAAGSPIIPAWDSDRSASLTLSSEDSQATGSSGCNRMMGGYTIDGSSIRFNAIAGTRMACPEPEMQVEQSVHSALEAVRSWEIQGDTLILRGEGAVMARLVQRP